jgi:NitT/TauT family transport system substrate-binding protein
LKHEKDDVLLLTHHDFYLDRAGMNIISAKRYFTLAIILASVIAVWDMAVPHRAMADDSLRVGKAAAQAFQFIPVDVGLKAGIFRRHQLDVESIGFAGSVKLQQGLMADGVDVGLSGGTDLAWVAKGTPVIGVAVISGSPRSLTLMVRTDSDIRTVADLKGRMVAISATGSLSDWLLRELARQQGWKPDEIRTVGLGAVTSMIAALKTKEVDSIFADLGVVYRLEATGEARRIVNFGDVVKDFYSQVVFATQPLSEQRAPVLRRFLAAWLETIAYMRNNRQATIDVAKDIMSITPEAAGAIYDELMPTFSTDGRFDPKASAVLSRSFVELQLLPTAPDMRTLYTEAFLPGR